MDELRWPRWDLSPTAKAEGDRTWRVDLPPPAQEGLSAPLLRMGTGASGALTGIDANHYADALLDLSMLVEEVRFEVGLAVMLLVDFAERCPAEVERLNSPRPWPHSVGIPTIAMALLTPHARPHPSPSSLTERLHESMGPDRHLSRWFAGQLLDSALVRVLSCLDRLATLLQLSSGRGVARTARGTLRMPAFGPAFVRELRASLGDREPLDRLDGVAQHELLAWAKDVRNGQIHARRWPSMLHGERKVVYSWEDENGTYQSLSSEGLTAQEHVGMLRALWEHALTPAVVATSDLVAEDGAGCAI